MKFKMVHENYNVADLDKSIAFYEKALGLHEVRRKNGDGFILVYMGDEEDNMDFEARVEHDFAVFIPAGKWHNLINDSDEPLKVYSIYSPVEHPHSTIHQTQAEGIAAHEAEHATEHGH